MFLSIENRKTIDRVAAGEPFTKVYTSGRPRGELSGYDDQTLLRTPGDGTVPAHRAVKPWLDDPNRNDLTDRGCLSGAGCKLPLAASGSNSAIGSAISIKTGNFGNHPNVFSIHECVLAALKNGSMDCNGIPAGKRALVEGMKAATATMPALTLSANGDAGLLVTGPSGQSTGQSRPSNVLVEQIPNSATVALSDSQSVGVDAPVDGSYAVNLTHEYFTPVLLRAQYWDGTNIQRSAERINVFPDVPTTLTAVLSAANSSAIALVRSPAKPTLVSSNAGGFTRLSWSVVAAAQKYRIYSYSEDQANFELIAEIPAPSTSFVTNYLFNSVTSALPRQFAVVAVDANANESFYSEAVLDNDTLNATFDISVSRGPAPLTVQFTDRSSGLPTAWSWDFNSDSVSDSVAQNPTFTYVQPGLYTVKLVSSNATQTSDPSSRLVRVDSTLTVQLAGAPVGTLVTVSPTTTDGTAQLASGQVKAIAYGTATTITAPVVAGAYSFSAWAGCATVAANICTVAGTTSITVTASYVPSSATTYTLSVGAGTGGTTAPSGASQRALGESITVTATPSSGFSFTNWTGYAGCGATASCTFSMPSTAVTLTANFTATPACTYSFNPTSVATLGPATGTGSFAVVTQSGCAISAPVVSSTGGWLGATLSGSTVNFTVTQNTDSAARAGTITVGTSAMTITQGGVGVAGSCGLGYPMGNWRTFGTASLVGGTLTVGDNISYDPGDADGDCNPEAYIYTASTAVDSEWAVYSQSYTQPISFSWTGCIGSTSASYMGVGLAFVNPLFTGAQSSNQLPVGQWDVVFMTRWENPGKLFVYSTETGTYVGTQVAAATSSATGMCGTFEVRSGGGTASAYFNGTLVQQVASASTLARVPYVRSYDKPVTVTDAVVSTVASPMNGVCGAADGAVFATPPATNLCWYGADSPVSTVAPWTWTCSGTNGGANASCAAQLTDTAPDAFSFAPQTNVVLNTVLTSNAVTITGINTAAPISVTGGSYSIGCTAIFTSAVGTIGNNQTVCVRHTTSAVNNTSVTTTLAVGGALGTFTTTTTSVVCSVDVVGSGTPLATPDGLLLLRYMLGFRGDGLTQGLSISAPRSAAADIEAFLAASDYSATGTAGRPTNVDGLIFLRLLQGVPDSALLNGINVPAGAAFRDAAAIRANVNARCGTAF